MKEYNKKSLPSTTMPIIDSDFPKMKNILFKKMKNLINRCNEKCKSTKDIIDDFGFITLTREFKYLGSIISYNVDDYSDISLRIKKANQAMGVLKFFWDSENIDKSAKVQIYLAIPINLLLWGCQTWALTKVLTKS